MDNINVRPSVATPSVNLISDSALGEYAEDSVAVGVQPTTESTEQTDIPDMGLASRLAKRSFDLLGAISIALVCLPVIIIIAIIIRLSGLPVVFSHQRVGKGRKMFSCYKFRTMIPDAEQVLQKLLQSDSEALREWRQNHKLRDDPRITKFGEFLRKSSFDELPQLWNVLKGDMSLVGPRPIVEDELERYGNKANIYLSVRPGITGLWQVMGRSNVTYSRRVSLDTRYVRRQTILLDSWILIRTAIVVFKRIGAH